MEPDRARWSHVLDWAVFPGAMALAFVGTALSIGTDNELWAFAGFMSAFALIGLAAFLRIIARPRPWRGMRLQMLVWNILAGAAIYAIVVLIAIFMRPVLVKVVGAIFN